MAALGTATLLRRKRALQSNQWAASRGSCLMRCRRSTLISSVERRSDNDIPTHARISD